MIFHYINSDKQCFYVLIFKRSFTYAVCICLFVLCVAILLFGVVFLMVLDCDLCDDLFNYENLIQYCCVVPFTRNYTHSLITFFLRMFMFLRVEAFDCLLMIIIKRKGKATFLLMIKNWLKLSILFMFLCSQKSMVLVICKWYQTKGFE